MLDLEFVQWVQNVITIFGLQPPFLNLSLNTSIRRVFSIVSDTDSVQQMIWHHGSNKVKV